jgi:hypothetical protein
VEYVLASDNLLSIALDKRSALVSSYNFLVPNSLLSETCLFNIRSKIKQ